MITTYILIGIILVASIYAWNRTERLYGWMLNPYSVVHRNEYYRLITSGFIHHDWVHLIFNIITLYFFGSNMEYIFTYLYGGSGILYYLVLYFMGMLIADIPTVIKHRDHPNYNSLGASGAVSAVLFASIIFNPTNKVCFFLAICIPGFVFGILYLLYTYYQGRKMSDNINHDAHLYGALFGIIFSIMIRPGVVPNFFDQIFNYQIF
ncbi:MAG: rhomboid family intramembrane serine protease [Cyclobacteriaceae bacterium]|nr:rhomboid family intramembrane serine protease [Cyclobacteriaceae bacterium]